jgi:hypothetical protein
MRCQSLCARLHCQGHACEGPCVLIVERLSFGPACSTTHYRMGEGSRSGNDVYILRPQSVLRGLFVTQTAVP